MTEAMMKKSIADFSQVASYLRVARGALATCRDELILIKPPSRRFDQFKAQSESTKKLLTEIQTSITIVNQRLQDVGSKPREDLTTPLSKILQNVKLICEMNYFSNHVYSKSGEVAKLCGPSVPYSFTLPSGWATNGV